MKGNENRNWKDTDGELEELKSFRFKGVTTGSGLTGHKLGVGSRVGTGGSRLSDCRYSTV